MSFDPGKSYWYTVNRQQRGPISGAEMRQLIQAGQLQAADLYWCDGMSDWQPLDASGVFSAVGTPPPLPPAAPASVSPTGSSPAAPMPCSAFFPLAPLQGVNFGALAALSISSFVIMVFAIALLVFGISSRSEPLIIIAVLVMMVASGLSIGAVAVGAIALYRAWAAIQGLPGVATTPGKAVGYMFIPFFSLYWGFIAVAGWAKDYNRFVQTYRLTGGPPVNEGLFQANSIIAVCCAIPLINYVILIPAMIVGLICMSQLFKATNFLKAQSEQTA